MGFRMKTTLNIDDTVMAELKREAARQGRTISELVETALRLLLRPQRKPGRIPALPTFRSGGARRNCRPRRLVPSHGGSLIARGRHECGVYAADADSQFYRPSTTARVRARAKR